MDMFTLLLINYLLVLFINGVISALCIYYYREKLYEYSLYLWIGVSVNLLLQGAFQDNNLAIVLSFSTYFLVFLIELKILSIATNLVFPIKRYSIFIGCCVGMSVLANFKYDNFTLTAIPSAFGIAMVMFHSAAKSLRSAQGKTNRGGVQIYSTLIVAHGLHLLDYPFLRAMPQYMVLGFSFAFVLLIAFSIFLPSFILKSVADRYVKKIEEVNTKMIENQRKMAELVSFAHIGEMSYGFVHDMASPTTILIHYASELAALNGGNVAGSEKMLAYSKGIEHATARLINLHKMFKTMLNTELESEPVAMDLQLILRNCTDLFVPFLAKHNIKLDIEITTTNAEIISIPGNIDRILINLLQNAINVLIDSPERRITLSLSPGENENLVILFGDSGPGIPKERLTHLWDRFGYSATAKKGRETGQQNLSGGSGFGLYKVKQLIDEIQGTIAVTETSPEGTVFKIQLPRFLHKTARCA